MRRASLISLGAVQSLGERYPQALSALLSAVRSFAKATFMARFRAEVRLLRYAFLAAL